MIEQVIVIDGDDAPVGTMDKMAAHVEGVLHRAFSVFVFNTKGQLLLQQRALSKYHSGGKWTNTCCSHPRPGEDTLLAAHRRLAEEMGMACELHYLFNFTYKAEVENELIEHELDHVFYAISDVQPVPEPEEVAAYKYVDMETLKYELENNACKYTKWLKICFERVKEHYQQIF